MASRRGDYAPRPRYDSSSSSSSSHVADGAAHRSQSRTQATTHAARHDARVPRSFAAHGRRRSNPLSAFVEDECDALAREHNPAPATTDSLAGASPQVTPPPPRGEIDQIPILKEVEPAVAQPDPAVEAESNPERRFVLVGAASDAPAQDNVGSRTSVASSTAAAPDPPASTVASATSKAASTASPVTSAASSFTPSARDHRGKGTEYGANTCRKFTVPRIDAESTVSEPSTIGSQAEDDAAASPRRHRKPTAGTGSATTAAAAVAAAAAAAAAAAVVASSTSRAEPEMRRRKSRVDLPRIDTDLDVGTKAATTSSTSRPRSATNTEFASRDGRNGREGRDNRDSRDSRDRLDGRSGHRDNEFLSPAFTKHSTNGRDRAYFDHSGKTGGSSGSSGLRARSGDVRPPAHDDRGTHDRSDRTTLSADTTYKRRSTSFSETDRLTRTPSYKRASRDGSTASVHPSRNSPSPPTKTRMSPPLSAAVRGDRRPMSPPPPPPPPPRMRDRDRERERDRDRDRDRDRERDRRSGYDDREWQKPSRRDSIQKKRRDSVLRPEDEYSSDDRSKRSSSTALPLRRRDSERRRTVYQDGKTVVSQASSYSDGPRPTTATSDVGIGGRYRPAGSVPLAGPRQSQSQFPFPHVAGSPPKDSFETRPPSSPPKAYADERRRKDDRRPTSSSSTSSSPDSRARTVVEGDVRPRGPRPRAHAPNVIHNPTGPSSSLPNLPQPTLSSRAATLPMPIPIPLPIPVSSVPSRSAGSAHDREEARYDQRRPAADAPYRARTPLAANPARTSGVFAHSPNSSQPYRQPAFYVNLPATPVDDGRPVNVQPSRPLERPAERPANGRRSPERTDRPAERSLVPAYGRYAEDVHSGRVLGLPECPRQEFSTRYRDWLVLAPFDDFLICPTCYDAAFARTPYRKEFATAPPLGPNEKTRCVFGSLHWYQVALFFTKACQMPTLSLLKTLFTKGEEVRLPCSGPRRVSGRWFTIQDPVTTLPVTNFSTCELCATAIRVLFPKLKDVLQDNEPSPHDTTNICALYYEPDRKRLWKYIDVLETANNAAVASEAPVDVNNLINRLLDVSRFDECKRDIHVRGRRWYRMRSIPDFTVCQECFEEAVLPKVNTYPAVAGDFYRVPKELPLAACHLYSLRMRDIFLRACQANDKDYLEQKMRERDVISADITGRIQRLPKPTSPHDPEQAKLLAEWKKWE